MAGADDSGAPGTLNLGALATSATTVLALVAGLSTSGTVGRVLRNDPEQMAWAIFAVLLGAALLAAAGLPATGKPVEVVFSLVGLELTLAGFLIAGVTGIRSADDSERPAIDAALVDGGRRVTGKVVVGRLAFDARVVAVVDGIVKKQSADPEVTRLERAEVGPDEDGKVALTIDMRVPAGRYDELRIAGWPVEAGAGGADGEPTGMSCGVKPLPTLTGCVALPLPPAPASPKVEAHWLKEDRIAVHVSTDNAAAPLSAAEGAPTRVVVVVKRRLDGKKSENENKNKSFRFYRAILKPDGEGKLDTKFQVPVGTSTKRVCVGAAFVAPDVAPGFFCRGRLKDFERSGQTVVQLRPPPAADE